MNPYDPNRIARCYPSCNSILHVPMDSEMLCNNEMDNKETRRQHLLLAIRDADNSIEELASRTGTNPKHLSQLKNGTRKIGDKFRAKMEEALGLPIGAWDQPVVVEGNMQVYLAPPQPPAAGACSHGGKYLQPARRNETTCGKTNEVMGRGQTQRTQNAPAGGAGLPG